MSKRSFIGRMRTNLSIRTLGFMNISLRKKINIFANTNMGKLKVKRIFANLYEATEIQYLKSLDILS